MKRIIALLTALLMLAMLVACGDDTPDVTTGGTGSTGDSTQNSTVDTGSEDGGEDKVDPPAVVPDNVDISIESIFGKDLEIFDINDEYKSSDITANYPSITEVNVQDSASGGKPYTIAKGGVYRLSGSSKNGQIYIKTADEAVILLLNNLSLSNTGSAPAIFADKCSSVTIILESGTTNYLSDSAQNGENGVIKVKSCDLTIMGNGTLNIDANSKYAISNTKNLTIKGGTYKLRSVEHGLYGKQGVTVEGGKFNIQSTKSAIKVGNSDENGITYGTLTIKGGYIGAECGTHGLNVLGDAIISGGTLAIKANRRAIDATGNPESTEVNVSISGGVAVFETKGEGIKASGKVAITEASNVKINSYANGIEASDLDVSTSGILHIKTNPVFVEDDNGTYKIEEGKYVKLDGTENDYIVRYSLIECRGVEIDNKISITSGKIAIESYQDALNAYKQYTDEATGNVTDKTGEISITGGQVVITAGEDALDSINVTVGADAELNVIWANKGINASGKIILDGGTTVIATKTEAIEAPDIEINGGMHYAFEKLDCNSSSNSEENGTFTIKGGTLISLSTPTTVVHPTTEGVGYAELDVKAKSKCTEGAYVRITLGEKAHIIRLPKDYTEKMFVLVAGAISADATLEFGVLAGGEMVHPFVYNGGEFTSEKTETIELK